MDPDHVIPHEGAQPCSLSPKMLQGWPGADFLWRIIAAIVACNPPFPATQSPIDGGNMTAGSFLKRDPKIDSRAAISAESMAGTPEPCGTMKSMLSADSLASRMAARMAWASELASVWGVPRRAHWVD
jgi:hypothetical protein